MSISMGLCAALLNQLFNLRRNQMNIVFQHNGQSHIVNCGHDINKILGNVGARTLVMTNESGAVIGAGSDVAALNRSQPLIKALRDARPLMKSVSNQQPARAFFQKSKTGFEQIIGDLEALKKSFA
jgi:hypothetical protein